tara:strand:+ start:977 stop:1348 length:372 start_codon:yes stop_codon:yes gene_type:complete
MTNNCNRVYSVLETKEEKGNVNYLIEIDFSHPVFQGHFPEKRVLPGVMMCDIIRYQCSNFLNLDLQLFEAKNIKFLRMIVPSKNNIYKLKIAIKEIERNYNVAASIIQDDKTYFKINARYKTK